MAQTLNAATLDRLFSGAHTTHTFTDQPVDPGLIKGIYEHVRWAPSAFNAQTLRLAVLTADPGQDSGGFC